MRFGLRRGYRCKAELLWRAPPPYELAVPTKCIRPVPGRHDTPSAGALQFAQGNLTANAMAIVATERLRPVQGRDARVDHGLWPELSRTPSQDRGQEVRTQLNTCPLPPPPHYLSLLLSSLAHHPSLLPYPAHAADRRIKKKPQWETSRDLLRDAPAQIEE